MTRLMKLAGAIVATGVLLAGCGTGPSKVGSAAIVGKDTVGLADLQYQITKVVDDKPVARKVLAQRKLDTVSRALLSSDIQHVLVGQLTASLGLRENPAEIRQALSSPQLDQQLVDKIFDRAQYAQVVADGTKIEDLARKLAPGLRLTVDTVVVGDAASAKNLAAQVAAQPARTAELMGAAGRAGINQSIAALQDPQAAASTPLFALVPNTVTAFPLGQQSPQWAVVRVLRRDQGPALAPPQVVDQLQPEVRIGIGQLLLAAYAQQVGVTINPRYGAWDKFGLSAVPDLSKEQVVSYPVGADRS